jgi:D-serine deaminase-like pyridoxal phosphate-dependent protein
VLATVIGHKQAPDRLLIDAGWMALGSDLGTAGHAQNQGYGLVTDATGKVLEGADLIVGAADQEHGLIERRGRGELVTLQRLVVN